MKVHRLVGPSGCSVGSALSKLVIVGALALCAAGHRLAVGRAASSTPIAIIAVDAADWQAIDPLIGAGRLPAFAALKAAGAVGTMRPDPPLLSPLIWTTIATGRTAEDHGVLDFLVDQPGGGQAPVGGGARRTKALWEIFSDAGRSVLIVGWWATWPADRVRGAIVTDRVAIPHLRLRTAATADAGLVYPPERLAEVMAAAVTPAAIDYASLNRFVPLTPMEFEEAVASERLPAGQVYRNRFAHVRAGLAATRTYGAVTAKLAPILRPSLIAVYFELVDTASHLFISDPRRREVAVRSAYVEVDQQIRTIAGGLDPDTLVIVMSDHGFYAAGAGIPDDPSDLTAGAAAWHRPYGVMAATIAGALAGTRTAPKLPTLGTVSPLDVAPTVLARAGLPIAMDMPGRVLTPLTGGTAVTKIATYGSHRPPEQVSRGTVASAAELERLRALGYVSGASAVTARTRINLGEILFRKGDFQAAIRELEAAVRADPMNQRAGLWLARAYSGANRPDDAARVYDRLTQGAAGGAEVDPILVLAATDLDLGRGRRSSAAARLAGLPASLSRRPETLVARASLAEAEQKSAEAERLYRAALEAQPANIDACRRLIDLFLRNGRTAVAAQVAVEAARRFPDSAERHALVGETALAERRTADAARAFRTALTLAPDAASVRVELARAELLDKRPNQALEAIGDLTSRDADALRGAAYSTNGDWAAAVQAYTRASLDGQPSIELLNALGYAQLESGRPADAVRTLERSLAIKADQPEIRALADRARRAAGRPNR